MADDHQVEHPTKRELGVCQVQLGGKADLPTSYWGCGLRGARVTGIAYDAAWLMTTRSNTPPNESWESAEGS